MDPNTTALAGWGFALAAAAHLALAIYLLLRRPERFAGRWTGRSLIAALTATALWAGLAGTVMLAAAEPVLPWVMPAFLLRCSAWTAFLVLLIRPDGRRWPQGFAGLLAALAVGVVVALTWMLFWPLAGGEPWSHQASALGFLGLALLDLMLVEQLFRQAGDAALWGAKPAGVALVASLCFDLYMYTGAAIFGGIDRDVFAVRGFVEVVAVPLLWLSLARRGDWMSSLRISQRAAFHSVALLIVGSYLVFVAGVGYYVRFFGGDWGRALQQGMVFLALLVLAVLAVSGSARARLRVFLSKNFFRYRYDYRDEWLKFTRALSSQATPQAMGHQVVGALADLVESTGGGLWMRHTLDGSLRQTARLNMPAVDVSEPADSALVQALQAQGLVVNFSEWTVHPARYGGGAPPDWVLALPQAWLAVPLRTGDDLVGFVLLLSPRTRFELNWEVYDLLKTAGRQAASFLAQMMATEALLEARKFDAFNRMSAFVVHDLKNIVTQLSLMLKNAQRHQANPEFQQDMLMTVENSLEKMRQMMAQLREGGPVADGVAGVDLAALLQRMKSLAAGQGRAIEVRVGQAAWARGSGPRLERVIGHWVQNAIDATEPAQAIELALDRFGGYARLVVADRGRGMSAAFVRDQLFRPFQSTKTTGMGIGAYESLQYVQELGGKISVESELGEGTKVVVLLPLFEKSEGPDLEILKSQP